MFPGVSSHWPQLTHVLTLLTPVRAGHPCVRLGQPGKKEKGIRLTSSYITVMPELKVKVMGYDE